MYELQYVPLALPFFLLFSMEGVVLPKMLPKAFTRSTNGHDSPPSSV
jgi:hypothetical protein